MRHRQQFKKILTRHRNSNKAEQACLVSKNWSTNGDNCCMCSIRYDETLDPFYPQRIDGSLDNKWRSRDPHQQSINNRRFHRHHWVAPSLRREFSRVDHFSSPTMGRDSLDHQQSTFHLKTLSWERPILIMKSKMCLPSIIVATKRSTDLHLAAMPIIEMRWANKRLVQLYFACFYLFWQFANKQTTVWSRERENNENLIFEIVLVWRCRLFIIMIVVIMNSVVDNYMWSAWGELFECSLNNSSTTLIIDSNM